METPARELTEFELIRRYFSGHDQGPGVITGIGDDAAVLLPPVGEELVVAIDTLVEGVHFPLDTAAADIGWKALAVNLSDLAAMGAEPAWFTLALTLPQAEPDWLADFSRGLFELAERFGLALVGGDTTRGPLTVTVQASGLVAPGQALRRQGARVGDDIYVSGVVGDAALALQQLEIGDRAWLDAHPLILAKLQRPLPRLATGRALRGLAHCAIDISDGLFADLQHLLDAAGVGAELVLEQIPVSEAVAAWREHPDQYLRLLGGGDDYELCFCADPQQADAVQQCAADRGIALSRIGTISAEPGLRLRDAEGRPLTLPASGYEHFRALPV